MNFSGFLQRQKELLNHFRIGKNIQMEDCLISIQSYEFTSKVLVPCFDEGDKNLLPDHNISENQHFNYQIFVPTGMTGSDSFILLLHGLNERSWDKYLIWAEYLAEHCRKPVILFPIAFHINRAPSLWSDPRSMKLVMDRRKAELGDHRSLSFVNAALSERLEEEPSRFYSSGRQTIHDIIQLTAEIREGKHPLFAAGAKADIFAYSIGSFLSEILLMANPLNLFTKSRLFVFCGGSIFSHMYGESRCIMDKSAYERLFHYYLHEWGLVIKRTFESGRVLHDDILSAFNAMINPDTFKSFRGEFFDSIKQRIRGISLQKDKVMPWDGVEACMGHELAGRCFDVLDFPYEYTHEFPFPVNGRIEDATLTQSFLSVFSRASAFLG
jgi:hypothetical protein